MKKLDRRGFMAGSAALAGATALPKKGNAKKLEPAYPIPDEPVTKDDWKTLKRMTAKVMAGNRRERDGYVFHIPSEGKYNSLFGWDSGWHAIAMSRLKPEIAASEIEYLFSFQIEETGRVPHDTVFEDFNKERNWYSRIGLSMGKSQYDEQGRTAMIDPPSYIIAIEKIFEKTGDRKWLDKLLPKAERCVHYMTHDRDLFGDGLVAVIHPWETGTDSSPAYDKLLNLDFSTPLGAPARGLLYHYLLDYNAKFDWDLETAKQKNRFILEDACFNSITMRAILSVAELCEKTGRAEDAAKYRQRAQDMMDAMDRINWAESEGCYFSRYDYEDPKLAMRTTCASLLPVFTGIADRDKALRIIEEHALNENEFWLDYLFPFSAADEMMDKIYLEDLVLWRGHCIWINMNWMMMHGLLNYGYKDEARELTRRTAKMIRHEGLWEFYDFRNGQGKGQPHFNWPGLVLDMIAVTWPEAIEQ
ncbi:MAG: trehalase family glycosidase [bacterium]